MLYFIRVSVMTGCLFAFSFARAEHYVPWFSLGGEARQIVLEEFELDSEKDQRLFPPSEKKALPITAQQGEIKNSETPLKPWTIDMMHGLGFFNLQQTGADISTSNWVVDFRGQKDLGRQWSLGIGLQTFVIPIASSGIASGPRLTRFKAEFGRQFFIGEKWMVRPIVGGSYQTFITSESVGFRDLIGPTLGFSSALELSDLYTLHGEASVDFFGTSDQLLTTANRMLDFRLFVEWKKPSNLFSAYYLGLGYNHVKLTLGSASYSSGLTMGFVGVRFR